MEETQNKLKQEVTRLVKQALTAPTQSKEDKRAIEILLRKIANLLQPFVFSASYEEHAGTTTPTGIALDPAGAINCFVSYRTVVFWKGVLAAIAQQRTRGYEDPIEIVDLGCGPLGGLSLPLCTQVPANSIKITLVDIHQSSINSVKQLIHALELGNEVNCPVQQDATLYQHPLDRPLHIAISETMYQALEKEGQVAIFHNIEEQLVVDGILIPEKITVNIELLDYEYELLALNQNSNSLSLNEIKQKRIFAKQVLVLSREAIKEHKKAQTKEQKRNILLGSEIIVSDFHDTGLSPFLTTNIQVYKNHVIEEYENGLTYPKAIPDQSTWDKAKKAQCNFIIDGSPRFELVTLN